VIYYILRLYRLKKEDGITEGMEVYVKRGTGFYVPSAVAEHLLKLATHQQLKVLLYMLAHEGEVLSAYDIAAHCGVQAEHVEEAMVFWRQVNVLSATEQMPAVGIQTASVHTASVEPTSVPEKSSDVSAVSEESVRGNVGAMVTSGSMNIRPSEIAQRAKEDQGLSAMLSAAEQYAGHPLRNTELRSLFWMHDYLGLSPDSILMLLAFCRQENIFQVRYMEQVALEWHDHGILTHEQVQQDIQRRVEARTFMGKVMKMFEMTRTPTEKQQTYIRTWQEAGDSLDLIRLAYERTRESCDDKLSFAYLDKILMRWRAEGLKTPKQVEAQENIFRRQRLEQSARKAEQSAKSASSSGEHSYDLEELKKLKNRI